ncbi:LamG-like jellyroll fold domain-containing protein [Flavobacterium ammonificans]|uniref:C-type lectin domain-containing protein n=1 Tax=Flavobacterium ammonificans TaxID=1751056 RepID=A0ABM7UYD3_9FLAO|nr:LamG-like jellyroll fold domain-containing protein [Flavobacterium ammonificans]BDB52412.1 hypothetical protein GENT11_07240 [Flavobacterium ammonificans]
MKLKLKTLLCISFLFTQLVFGQSLKLTNTNQYVNIGDLDITGNQLTVEAKIFMSSTSAYAMNIVSKHTDSSNLNYLLRPKTFEISTSNGFYLMNNPYALELNKWYHVAGTYDGQFVRYYVNGCLVIKNPATGNLLQNNINTGIGNRTSNFQEFEQFFGSIDEVRIWNVCRSENDIKNNMNTLPNPSTQVGLKGYYKFNSNLLNEIANINHGAAVGSIQYDNEATSINTFNYTGYTILSSTCSQYTVELLSNVNTAQYSLNGTNYSTSNSLTISPGNQNIWIRSPEGCVIQSVLNLPPISLTTPAFNQIAPICSGGTISLPLTSNNGITGTWSPALNNTATTTYTFTPNNGQCGSTATMTISILPAVVAPTGSSTQFFCSSTTISDLVVTGNSIKWYDAATGGNLIPSTTSLVNGNTYYASASSSSCESLTRLAVTTTIENIPEITASATEVCIGDQVNLKINNSSQSLSQFQLANPDLILFKTIGSHSYFYKNQATTWPGAKIHGDQIGASMYIINDANEELSVYNALPSRGNDGIQYWIGLYQDLSSSNYSEPSGGWKWVDNSPLQYTNWYTGEPNNTENSENFGQIEWNVFGMKWNDAGDPSNNSCGCTTAFPIYEIENLATYSYLWSTGETTSSINPKPLVTTTYWVDVTTNESTCRKSITITVKNTPAPTGAAKQQFCNDSTIAALAVNGTDVKWFASATGTTALNNTTALVNETNYFATQTIDGCESTNRFQTTVSIVKVPTPKGDEIQKFCLEENLVISNLIVTGNSILWFDALTNGMTIDNATLLQDNTTYYATTIDAATGCESLQRLAVKVDLFKCNITAYNLITINGNSLNDQLTFDDISYFQDNSVKIYNRYGKLVWETSGYDNMSNAFKGKANVSGVYMKDSFLPSGTYFFILVYNNTFVDKQTELTGYLQIDNAN